MLPTINKQLIERAPISFTDLSHPAMNTFYQEEEEKKWEGKNCSNKESQREFQGTQTW